MDLPQSHERPNVTILSSSDCFQEGCAITLHRFWQVFPSKAKVKGVASVGPGKSAGPGAETMKQPWNARERFGLQWNEFGL